MAAVARTGAIDRLKPRVYDRAPETLVIRLGLVSALLALGMRGLVPGPVLAGSEEPSPQRASQPSSQTTAAPSSQTLPQSAPAAHTHGRTDSPDPKAAMEAMEATDRWATMVHGYAFITSNRQGGKSGDRDFESENHLQLMTMRRWAGGKLSLLGTFT